MVREPLTASGLHVKDCPTFVPSVPLRVVLIVMWDCYSCAIWESVLPHIQQQKVVRLQKQLRSRGTVPFLSGFLSLGLSEGWASGGHLHLHLNACAKCVSGPATHDGRVPVFGRPCNGQLLDERAHDGELPGRGWLVVVEPTCPSTALAPPRSRERVGQHRLRE